jgi:hypothetical protein
MRIKIKSDFTKNQTEVSISFDKRITSPMKDDEGRIIQDVLEDTIEECKRHLEPIRVSKSEP